MIRAAGTLFGATSRNPPFFIWLPHSGVLAMPRPRSALWKIPTRIQPFLNGLYRIPTFLIIPSEGKPIAVIPSIGENALSQCWIEELHIWASPNPADEGISLLAATLMKLATRYSTIGMPMGPETYLRMPANDVMMLRTSLKSVDIVDSTNILLDLRMVKSDLEIAKHRFICEIVSDAYDNMGHIAQAGLTEREIQARYRLDVLGRGADTVPYIVATSAHGGTDDAIRFPTERKLGDGDVLFIDTGAEIDGYYCDFDRNFALGHVADETKYAYELCYQATEAGITAARPGAMACDVWLAMHDVLSAGGAKGSGVGRMGHGVGLANTEWPSLMPTDQTILRDGMVLAIEPGYDFGVGKLMLHEENIVVREGGAEILTRRAPEIIPCL